MPHTQPRIKQEPMTDIAAMALESPFVDLLADDEVFLLDTLMSDEPSMISTPLRMMSPVATSDVARIDMPRPATALTKPVSPFWGAARLDDTMGAPLPKCSSHACKQLAIRGGRCTRHAGSRLCSAPGCTKNNQSNGYCIRHGGGRRCEVEGCPRGAQARGKCKTHGGGVRCKAPGCTRASQGSGLCRTHGGGKLCDYPGCKKGTQRHGKCSSHGGARRCRIEGCERVDRGGGLCGRHKTEATSSASSDSDSDDKNAVV